MSIVQEAYLYIEDKNKVIYETINNTFAEEKNEFDLEDKYDLRMVLKYVERCLIDNPQVFWLKSSIKVIQVPGKIKCTVSEISEANKKIPVMKKELNEKVDIILNSQLFKNAKNDLEKIKAIYQYIQENTEYDYQEIQNNANYLSHTAYGALVLGKSVCDGNAKAAIILCRKLGITCMGITGSQEQEDNSNNHAWLLVKIDSIWYHFDPTFRRTINNRLVYDGCIQSDKSKAKFCSWVNSEYPKCDMRRSEDNKVLLNKNNEKFIYGSIELQMLLIEIFEKYKINEEVTIIFQPRYGHLFKKVITDLIDKIAKKYNRRYISEFNLKRRSLTIYLKN